jgi:hypothetical protein
MSHPTRHSLLVLALAASGLAPAAAGEEHFFRGDCNASREGAGAGTAVDVADAAAVLSFAFGPEGERFAPPCLDACDANDDGAVDFADVFTILDYLSAFGPPPPAPGAGLDLGAGAPTPPGPDPTADRLDCASTAVPPAAPDSCDDGADNDGDGLTDLDDEDCQIVFALGGPLDDDGQPGPIVDWSGTGWVEVHLYLRNPPGEGPAGNRAARVEGLSIAIAFPCDVFEARESFDIYPSVLQLGNLDFPLGVSAEFVSLDADNASPAQDGDGCEVVVTVLIDVLPPYGEHDVPPGVHELYEELGAPLPEELTLTPVAAFQPLGQLLFEVREDAACGTGALIAFADGLDGRGLVPVRNLVSAGGESFAPELLGAEFTVVREALFHRGDCNYSLGPAAGAAVDLADAAALVSFLFARGAERFAPPCLDACDANDDGAVDLADAAALLQYLFQFGRFPPAPGPGIEHRGGGVISPVPPGVDPTPDVLDCAAGTACELSPFAPAGEPEVAFACGACGLVGGGDPGTVDAEVGGVAEVCLYIRNPEDGLAGAEQLDEIEGFSMALTFSCELAASPFLDLAGTALAPLRPDFVSLQADNDPDDGDGCELAAAVIIDVLPPFGRETLPRSAVYQPLGKVLFAVPDDPGLAGTLVPVEFVEGANGRGLVPVRNLVTSASYAHVPATLAGTTISIVASTGAGGVEGSPLPFRRGDADGSGRLDITDAAYLLAFLFLGGPPPPCRKSADSDDDGRLAIADPIRVLGHLFLGGTAPPPPFAACGRDPSPDPLDCERSPCEG